MVTRRFAPLAVLGLTLLAGCAGVSQTSGDAANNPLWQARSSRLAKLADWALAGRIGVSRERDGWSASLDWHQRGEAYAIRLLGPFGQGRLAIEGDAAGVVVDAGDGRPIGTTDPDGLVAKATGLEVPVRALRDWVIGRPVPGEAAVLSADAQGRLTRLEQAGWVVEYTAYDDVAGVALPSRIRASRGELQVRLAIERWTL